MQVFRKSLFAYLYLNTGILSLSVYKTHNTHTHSVTELLVSILYSTKFFVSQQRWQ